jgi:hypothetical protein
MTTVTLTTASSSPWNVPAGVTSVDVQCWGPGGNGANGQVNSHSGAGGGGGEYAEVTTLAVPSGGTASFTVGSGGSGTATSFTGSSVTVTANAGTNGSGIGGGNGGTGSTNAIHDNGGDGGNGHTGTGNQGGGGGGGSGGASGAGGTGGPGTASAGGSGGSAGSGGGAAGGAGAPPAGSPGAGSAPGGGGGGGRSTSSISGSGAAGADGQITLTYTASTTHSGTATLTGSGTLTATGAFAGKATLTGSGTITWSGSRVYKATVLSGSGTLSGTRHGNVSATAALTGTGTLTGARGVTHLITSGSAYTAAYTATYPPGPGGGPALTGTGTLTISGVRLGFPAALAGTGTLTVIGTGGTVQAAAGLSSPYALPGTSQVAVAAPGTASWQYLGTLGLVTSLTYSFVCPGGADKLTATVMIPAAFRTQLLNPGWQVRVTRGGHTVWTGRLDEPVPSGAGWQVTAVGDGQRGQDFRAVYTSTWPSGEPDQAVNNAIARGLPWVNPGVGTPSGIWLGQAQDSGSSTIADLLNLACTRGGLTWYASSQPGGQPGTDLSVFPLPTAVNRILVVTDPVARTLGGDINTIYIRYQISDASSDAGGGSQQATFGLTSVTNAASAAAHGVTETSIDLSCAGVMSAGAAQAVGNKVLGIYQRASFAGPFTAARGQLLNTGGAPVDPGTDQAGTVVRLILTDYAYGGEVAPGGPVTFIVGSYTWDDFSQKATIVPYQRLDESLSGLLSMQSTVLTPITTQQ